MNKFLKYLGIFCGCVIMLIYIMYIIVGSMKDTNYSDSDFSEQAVKIKYNTSKIGDIPAIMKKYIFDKYDLPLYLRVLNVRIIIENGDITSQFINFSFATYKKQTDEYGDILVHTNLIDSDGFFLNASFGYPKSEISLKDKKNIWDNLKNANYILDSADTKMKEVNKGKYKYKYYVRFSKKVTLYNETDKTEYIYDNEKQIFVKKQEKKNLQ